MRKADWYQISLIALGITATGMFGVFLYRELFPEYRIYQDDYVALEKFLSTYTHEPPPSFKAGVKQILIEREDHGPPKIDRCISCHVALQFPHFSPTKIAYDINGNIERDGQGNPVQIPNEMYVWDLLDKKVEELLAEGRTAEANRLSSLKTVDVNPYIYDVTKALRMHPLLGKETRPFEFHSIEEYGCVSCHNGDGRSLTTDKAHGPVFDETYETEFMGPSPKFTESDPENDPAFARMFNHKPGATLLFQTTPLFVGPLIQAKCMQCHQNSQKALQTSFGEASRVIELHNQRANKIQTALAQGKEALASLLILRQNIEKNGLESTLNELKQKSIDYTQPETERFQQEFQSLYFTNLVKGESPETAKSKALNVLHQQIVEALGSDSLAQKLEEEIAKNKEPIDEKTITEFLEAHQQDPEAKGTLFVKFAEWNLEQEILRHLKDTSTSLETAVSDTQFLNSVQSDIDLLTKNYHRGEELFISQACYACHRIDGMARGGVGPDLTRIGSSYPWYIKESIVWPQADLPTSTMPNYRLDHEELQDLMTFLLGQNGSNNAIAESVYKQKVQSWEAGKKTEWEKPVSPSKIHDVRYGMYVFATEGCAACHRLKGFTSDVGFSIEKDAKNPPSFDALYQEHQWFKQLFPEDLLGSDIVRAIEQNAETIDQRIVDHVRSGSILEEIEEKAPEQIESLYTNFKYALRAKNHAYATQIAAEKDPKKREALEQELTQWKKRVQRVRMMYIQEYGLGRLLCPRPNWSGVYHTDEWLMEHFRNPTAHVPRSLMPIFPFDETKFALLTHTLDALGIINRDAVREIWKHDGFSPEQAYQIHCAQCHGEYLLGNGPVSDWIYPIPKNLRNADFLRNLTKERAIQSITHGVKGTPMAPWGEVGADKPNDGIPVLNQQEISLLVDWIFGGIPGEKVIRSGTDVPKWQYDPEDVLKELYQEGNTLPAAPEKEETQTSTSARLRTNTLYASLDPLPQSNAISNLDVEELFDILPNFIPGPDQDSYYIKKKYYTQANIDAGRQFFEMNCAACHGKEGDGSSLRAEVMKDAKPRMLTNLDWIETRDDLRLLRSIKYGVPGTAMTPWGDLTSSLQRLQLVIFIRTLTANQLQNNLLSTALYNAFEKAKQTIDSARSQEYHVLETMQKEYKSFQKLDDSNAPFSDQQRQEALENYKLELDLRAKIQQQEARDNFFTSLKNSVQSEQKIYQELSQHLISSHVREQTLELFVKLIDLNEGRYKLNDNKLEMINDPAKEQLREQVSKQILAEIDQMHDQANQELARLNGQLPSPERANTLKELTIQVNNLTKLHNTLVAGLEEAARLRKEQAELISKESNTHD